MRMRFPTMVGVVWLACLPMLPHGLRGWTLPLLLGLLAAWPTTVLSSRVEFGRWARAARLLLTPEEVQPPSIVRAYQRALLTPGAAGPQGKAAAILHLASGEAA